MMASTTTQPTVTTKPALPGSNLFWIRAREIFSDPGLPEPRRGAEEVLGESEARRAIGLGSPSAGRRHRVIHLAFEASTIRGWRYRSVEVRSGPLPLTLQAVIAYAYFLPPISGYFADRRDSLPVRYFFSFPERVRWVGFVAVVASWSTTTCPRTRARPATIRSNSTD